MNKLNVLCPQPPDWRVRWWDLSDAFGWVRELESCPQDAIFHAEGDVGTHTGMVLEALATDAEFRALQPDDRLITFTAALLHDVAKPVCTRIENGRITARGHSQRGSVMARRILWEIDFEFEMREQVCALIRHHQAPFYLLTRPDSQEKAFLISQSARCDLLSVLARADASGRTCSGQDEMLLNVELFREYCRDHGCLHGPRAFPSNQSRFLYFRNPDRDPEYRSHDDPRCEVTVMAGLPGAGKDTWVAKHRAHLPQISLDQIREDLDAGPTGNQGAVIQAARERARVLLRTGTDFVWNATNVSREIRGQVVDLATAYRAYVRIVYVEARWDDLFQQNRARSSMVPPQVIERLVDRWEVPDVTEAQNVEWWIGGKRVTPPADGDLVAPA